MAIGQLRRKQKQLADREHKLERDLEKVRCRVSSIKCSVCGAGVLHGSRWRSSLIGWSLAVHISRLRASLRGTVGRARDLLISFVSLSDRGPRLVHAETNALVLRVAYGCAEITALWWYYRKHRPRWLALFGCGSVPLLSPRRGCICSVPSALRGPLNCRLRRVRVGVGPARACAYRAFKRDSLVATHRSIPTPSAVPRLTPYRVSLVALMASRARTFFFSSVLTRFARWRCLVFYVFSPFVACNATDR